jgi:anti-sigma regulatory factor (Ser/Thr protein kinase)
MAGPRFLLEQPATFLHWLAPVRQRGWASFDELDVAQVFAITAIAALARHDGRERLTLVPAANTGAARFAHAIGLDEVVEGGLEREPTERERTVTLTRVRGRRAIESTARKVADLLLPPGTARDASDLFWFVLVELLRNVGQHSEDPAGGIVAAQRNDAGPYERSPALQVVVVDNGIGVFEALRRARSDVRTPGEALARALEPHVSGTFAEGQSGTVENAGLGLFFVSEMAKLTKGRLLLASRGATYFLDRSRAPDARPVITNGDAPDYPGTLVVFETALSHVGSYARIVADIHELAARRTPTRITHRWLRFEEPPPGTPRILVTVAAEDTVAAHAFASATLEPKLLRREAVLLDFLNLRVCTQSFLHALLHESVRLAWARKVPMYVVNATPAVRAQLEFVESYSLGG